MEIKAQFLPGFCMIFLVKSWLPNKWLVSYLWEEAKHFAGKCEFAQDVSQNIQMILMNSTRSFQAPTPQNGQTHSNNSLAKADKLYECVWPFCEFDT